MNKFFTLALVFTSTFLFSQEILFEFPEGQESYKGGNVQFYKDFNRILKEKNLAPCANKNEIYKFDVLVNPDNKINFVADSEAFGGSGSKCAKDLSREVAKYLQAWNAAIVDDEKVPAIASFIIIPDELFGTLKENYDINKAEQATVAHYPGGINEFRNDVAYRVDLTKFTYEKQFRLEVTFVVERDGSIAEMELSQSSGLKVFDDMVLRSISKSRKKWNPATLYGKPVRYRFKLPLVFQTE